MPRINETLVKGLEPPAKGNRLVWDDQLRGFGVRITAAGAVAFVLRYVIDKRERRLTIGQWPEFKAVEARERARVLRQEIAQGIDPLGEREARRDAPTVQELAEEYRRLHLPKNRASSQLKSEDYLRRFILPELGDTKLEDLTHRDVQMLHAGMADTPYQANRVVALLRKMLNLALRWEWLDRNVAIGIERNQEPPRQRYLTPEELTRLSDALRTSRSGVSADVVRWLLLTGCRVSEALQARWSHIDEGSGTWVKPSSHTKQKREHSIPLSGPALALLRDLDRSTPYLFPGKDGQPMKSIKTAWSTLRRDADIEDVRVHDLRHTYASMLASSGQSLLVIGQLLGHSQPATTARYAHLLDEPLRQATERVGAMVNGGDKAQVTKLKQR